MSNLSGSDSATEVGDWSALERGETGESAAAQAAAFYAHGVNLRFGRHLGAARRLLARLVALGERVEPETRTRGVLLLLDVLLACRGPERALVIAEHHAPLLRAHSPEALDLFEQLRLRAALMVRKRQAPPSATSLAWLFLRAHQQYVNGEVREAAATLSQYRSLSADAPQTRGDAGRVWAALNNDLAVLYLAMNKCHLSVKYMQQAIKEHDLYVKNAKAAIEAEGGKAITDDRPLYVYNLGIALLKASRHEDAFDCLVEAVRHFPNNPRIWIRMAECCVAGRNTNEGRDRTFIKIGSGPHAKFLPGGSEEKYAVSGESYAFPTLSLEFAALCLTNAVTLMPYREPPADAYLDQCIFLANPADPMTHRQYCELRNSALLLYSYVSLRLKDFATALEHSTALLRNPGSPTHCTLARLYSAEALLALDRIPEAMEQLDPSSFRNHIERMSQAARETVQFAVFYNSAVCQAVLGNFQVAQNILHQLASPRTLPLQLYLETCAGNSENCRALLRKFKLANLG